MQFKYKPGDVNRRPRFTTPHMPRLDWQMWFQALPGAPIGEWFPNLVHRLLKGTPGVLDLMDTNPFTARPPRYVRGILYEYEFTDPSQRTRAWWRRERLGIFFMPVSLVDFPSDE